MSLSDAFTDFTAEARHLLFSTVLAATCFHAKILIEGILKQQWCPKEGQTKNDAVFVQMTTCQVNMLSNTAD